MLSQMAGYPFSRLNISMYQSIMLYTLNLHNVICQIYLIKKIKHIGIVRFQLSFNQKINLSLCAVC